MNPSPNGDSPSFLGADEASVIETAVRTAVLSILKVFNAVDGKRAHFYELKLAEKEKENAELRSQLKAAEQEIETLRQISSNSKISAEVTVTHDTSPDVREEREEAAASSQSDGSPVVKEEPSSPEITLCIKREIPDETFVAEHDYPVLGSIQVCKKTEGAEMWNVEHLQTFSSERPSSNQTTENRISGNAVMKMRTYSQKIRADPQKYLAWKEKERLRKKIQNLPKHMQTRQREIWREATRRYRARKREQAELPVTSTMYTPST